MRVTILDLDWFNNVRKTPHISCMKISSYYKQLGYVVNFPTKRMELTYDFDEFYIVRDSLWGEVPEEVNLLDLRMKLVGKAFRFHQRRYELPPVVLACIPDYNLYDLPDSNRMAYSNMVGFYDSWGNRLPVMQDYHSSYEKAKDTVVTDVDFWAKKIEDVRACVQFLKDDENIVFSQPISLQNFLGDNERQELFFSLHCKYRGCCIFTGDLNDNNVNEVFDFLYKINQHMGNQMYKCSYEMYNPERADIDNIESAFSIAAKAKKNGINLILKAPPRIKCALWCYYEDLEQWSRYGFHSSYVQYAGTCQSFWSHLEVRDVLMNSIHWGSTIMQNMADIINRRYSIIQNYGFVTWLDREDFPYIELDKVVKKNRS